MKPNDKAYQAAIEKYAKLHGPGGPIFYSFLRAALDAAYAAQFQSEDYDALLKSLHANAAISQTESENQLDEHGVNSTLYIAAADAIEALLADRDALKAELAAARQEISEWIVKFQELFDRPNASYNEKWDAIFCRLVSRGMDHSYAAYIADRWKRRLVSESMGNEKLVDIALQKFKRVYNDTHVTRAAQQRTSISAAIAAIRPHIEAAERERCAKKILETNWVDADPEAIAAAIRMGK